MPRGRVQPDLDELVSTYVLRNRRNSLPAAIDLIAGHIRNLAPAKLDRMLIGWTMGGCPSPNFQRVQRLGRVPTQDTGSEKVVNCRWLLGQLGE